MFLNYDSSKLLRRLFSVLYVHHSNEAEKVQLDNSIKSVLFPDIILKD